jgi:hypothetical protein
MARAMRGILTASLVHQTAKKCRMSPFLPLVEEDRDSGGFKITHKTMNEVSIFTRVAYEHVTHG